MKNRVTVKIMDTAYTIVADDSEEYVEKVAKTVDKKLREVLEGNERASVTMAAVMAAFNCCDEALRAGEAADNLRAQLRGFIEESSRFKAEAEDSRREADKLKTEVASLKLMLARYEKRQ